MEQNPFTKARVKRDTVFYHEGEPDTIKADCKEGFFIPLGEKPEIVKDGKEKPNPLAVKSITVQPFKHYSIRNAVLFPAENGEDKKRHDWTQLHFIDTRGVLCAVLLKNESRDNFLKYARDIEIDSDGTESFVDYELTMTMSRRDSKTYNSKYYAIEFDKGAKVSKKDYDRNVEFSQDMYPRVYCARTFREYVQQNVPNWEQLNLAEVCAKMMVAHGAVPKELLPQLTGEQAVLPEIAASAAETADNDTGGS